MIPNHWLWGQLSNLSTYLHRKLFEDPKIINFVSVLLFSMYVTEVSDFEFLSGDFDEALSSLSVSKRLSIMNKES